MFGTYWLIISSTIVISSLFLVVSVIASSCLCSLPTILPALLLNFLPTHTLLLLLLRRIKWALITHVCALCICPYIHAIQAGVLAPGKIYLQVLSAGLIRSFAESWLAEFTCWKSLKTAEKHSKNLQNLLKTLKNHPKTTKKHTKSTKNFQKMWKIYVNISKMLIMRWKYPQKEGICSIKLQINLKKPDDGVCQGWY